MMSFLIDARLDNQILLYAAALLQTNRDGTIYYEPAIALDAIRLSFQTLEEATRRMYNNLEALTHDSSHASIIDSTRLINSVMADVWLVIDHTKRVDRFAKKLEIQYLLANQEYAAMIALVTKARDSFQHLDERVSQYYINNQGSINGDLTWRYRGVSGEPDSFYSIDSAASCRHVTISSDRVRQGISFTGLYYGQQTGIYDVVLHCVQSENRDRGPFSVIEVSLDEIAASLNSLIRYLESVYQAAVAPMIGKSSEQLGYSLPIVLSIRPNKSKD